MKRYLSMFLLGAAFLVPVAVKADDDHRQVQRYYDRNGRDWHEWNPNEQQAYNRYAQEQHRQAREFEKQKRRDQERYFRWRHNHSDSLLNIQIR